MEAEPFNCVRCSRRVTRRESLGMLQCSYHPHVHGPLRPVPSDYYYAAEHCSSNTLAHKDAGKCRVCKLTYVGQHAELDNASRGCTSVDHLEPGIDFYTFLLREPYEVMPLSKWKCAKTQYVAAKPSEKFVYFRKRAQHGAAAVMSVVNINQVVCEKTRKKAHLRVILNAPQAMDCGIHSAHNQRAFDAGLFLPIEELYNESAAKYGYAMMNESSWETDVLQANRHFLRSDEPDADEGYTTLTAEEICVTELYADTHCVEEYSKFVPFVIILRVEPREVRVEFK